jgi:hypothetical protein
MDIKIALKLKVGPMVEGVPEKPGQSVRPGKETVVGVGVFAGDKVFIYPVGPENPPLVMIAEASFAQPHLGQVNKTPVIRNLLRGKVAMVIENCFVRSCLVEKFPGCCIAEKKIPAHKFLHLLTPCITACPKGPML